MSDLNLTRKKYQLTVTLFGKVAAASLTAPLPFRSDKVRALLAYLVIHRSQPLPRADLVDKLFGESPEAIGRKNLNLTLTRLRQTLAPVQASLGNIPLLDTDREQVQLHWPQAHCWADVAAFAALQETCRQHPHVSLVYCHQCQPRLKQMADLYQGPFLDGLHLRDQVAFNEWLLWQQERFQQQMMEVLFTLTENALAAANYHEAILYAQRQISLVPWQEQGHRQLIQAWLGIGEVAAAQNQFNTLKQILAEKFQVLPGEKTIALMRPAAAPPTSPPANTPANYHLNRLLLDPTNRLITVLLPEDSDPTGLAQTVAHQLAPQFPDGVWPISLADCDPADPETITQTIAAALPTQPSVLSPQPSLLSYLRPRHILLILYPFTPFIQSTAPADGVTLVMDILQEAPQVTMMVVASRPLQLQQEIVYRL